MHATAFTDVGVLVDVVIRRRVEETRFRGSGAATHGDRTASCGNAPPCPSPVLYECEGTSFPLRTKRFHHMDVLPFGLRCPSEVFSVIGRHTQRGLVIGVTPKGRYRILPYDAPLGSHGQAARQDSVTVLISPEVASVSPGGWGSRGGYASRSSPSLPTRAAGPAAASAVIQPPQRLSVSQAARPSWRRDYGPHGEVGERLRLFFETAEALKCEAAGGGDGCVRSPSTPSTVLEPAVLAVPRLLSLQDHLEECELWELALPPALTCNKKVPAVSPPHRVGSRVMARRFGYGTAPLAATVIAAQYDITYTLKYDVDGGKDVGVLHNDVYLVDDSEADPCGVRDVVMLTLQKLERAVIVEACGNGVYRAILPSDPTRAILEVRLSQVVHVAPLLKDAIWSDPAVVRHFKEMDPNQTGLVKWKDVRQFIMRSESYGLPLSFQQMGELQRELRVLAGRTEPQLMWMASVQEEDMLLSFPEFDFVVTRAKNLM